MCYSFWVQFELISREEASEAQLAPQPPGQQRHRLLTLIRAQLSPRAASSAAAQPTFSTPVPEGSLLTDHVHPGTAGAGAAATPPPQPQSRASSSTSLQLFAASPSLISLASLASAPSLAAHRPSHPSSAFSLSGLLEEPHSGAGMASQAEVEAEAEAPQLPDSALSSASRRTSSGASLCSGMSLCSASSRSSSTELSSSGAALLPPGERGQQPQVLTPGFDSGGSSSNGNAIHSDSGSGSSSVSSLSSPPSSCGLADRLLAEAEVAPAALERWGGGTAGRELSRLPSLADAPGWAAAAAEAPAGTSAGTAGSAAERQGEGRAEEGQGGGEGDAAGEAAEEGPPAAPAATFPEPDLGAERSRPAGSMPASHGKRAALPPPGSSAVLSAPMSPCAPQGLAPGSQPRVYPQDRALVLTATAPAGGAAWGGGSTVLGTRRPHVQAAPDTAHSHTHLTSPAPVGAAGAVPHAGSSRPRSLSPCHSSSRLAGSWMAGGSWGEGVWWAWSLERRLRPGRALLTLLLFAAALAALLGGGGAGRQHAGANLGGEAAAVRLHRGPGGGLAAGAAAWSSEVRRGHGDAAAVLLPRGRSRDGSSGAAVALVPGVGDPAASRGVGEPLPVAWGWGAGAIGQPVTPREA